MQCCAVYFWQLVLVALLKERIQDEWIPGMIQKVLLLEQQG